MILNLLLTFGVNLLLSLFPLLSLITIPVSTISVLTQITGVAAWIVGKDLLLLMFSLVSSFSIARLAFAIFHLFLKIKG